MDKASGHFKWQGDGFPRPNPVGAEEQARALFSAIGQNQVERVRDLVDAAPKDAKNSAGWTPVMLAANGGRAEILQILLGKFPAQRPGDGQLTALMLAASNGHVECVRLLTSQPDAGANARNNDGQTALMLAGLSGKNKSAEIAQILAPFSDMGARDQMGRTALIWATVGGNEDCVNFLASVSDAKAQDNYGLTALHTAAFENSTKGLAALLRAGGAATARMQRANGETPLHAAIKNGNADIVKKLAPFSDLSIQDNKGDTALRLLFRKGQVLLAREEGPAKTQLPLGEVAFSICVEALAPFADVDSLRKLTELYPEDLRAQFLPVSMAVLEGHQIRQAMKQGQEEGPSRAEGSERLGAEDETARPARAVARL